MCQLRRFPTIKLGIDQVWEHIAPSECEWNIDLVQEDLCYVCTMDLKPKYMTPTFVVILIDSHFWVSHDSWVEA